MYEKTKNQPCIKKVFKISDFDKKKTFFKMPLYQGYNFSTT